MYGPTSRECLFLAVIIGLIGYAALRLSEAGIDYLATHLQWVGG